MSKLTTAIAAIALFAVAGCDFYPGSKYGWNGSFRIWEEIPNQSGGCMLLGTYVFEQAFEIPPFDVKSGIKLTPQDKQQREFLPQFLDLRYNLNGGFHYQINYELKKGKGKASQSNLFLWEYEPGDELDMLLCTNGGDIPQETRLDLKLQFKFAKDFAKDLWTL